MEALFIKLLDQLNSSVFMLIALLIVALWGMYKFGGMVKTFTDVKEKNKVRFPFLLSGLLFLTSFILK